tara:strand:+ start:9850 stop:10287 length:438 start_codon:yes stop_codon:yes gene_type:complete
MVGEFAEQFSNAGELAVGAGVMAALIGIGIAFAILLIAGIYIYTSLAWMTIGRKLKYKRAWLAWIPVADISMILQLGRFHWAWVFLVLIPVAGWIALGVLVIISKWRIYRKRKYPGWFSLAILVPQLGWILNLIVYGFVAWGDRK